MLKCNILQHHFTISATIPSHGSFGFRSTFSFRFGFSTCVCVGDLAANCFNEYSLPHINSMQMMEVAVMHWHASLIALAQHQARHFSFGLVIVTLMYASFLPYGKFLRLRLQCVGCATCKRVVLKVNLARAQVHTPEIVMCRIKYAMHNSSGARIFIYLFYT